MCTITLSYDQNNALARRKLAALMKTGLFTQGKYDAPADSVSASKMAAAHRKEVEEFLYASRILSANAFAKHL